MDPSKSENARRALAGELFHAFVPDLIAARTRCKNACHRYNTAGDWTRRRQIELWRDIVADKTPLPPPLADQDLDDAQLEDEPWIEPPFRVDYGTNLRLGRNVYILWNCTILDTNLVTIGSRTLISSNVSLYSATHPLDPAVRNGTKGPELGKEIRIGDDCLIGGSVTVCPGVTIGNGSTVGAGSVVTKDVPAMCVVAGNPARVIRWLDGSVDGKQVDGKQVDGRQVDGNGILNREVVVSKEVGEAEGSTELEISEVGFGQKEQKHQENGVRVESTTSSNLKDLEAQIDSERLMTRQEWEDEMGRQIAERALSYGASLG